MTGTEAIAHKMFKAEYLDSVEVSLLTCQPHDEVYSLYGHTALRWHDLHEDGADIAFNWGVFNFNAPHFVTRFVFGLTDYELGGFPYSAFQREYQYYGSMVTEQVLNLTAGEKQAIYDALKENLRPENRIYRYNFFYNNCTTQARDIIEHSVSGEVEYTEREDYTPTYRQMVHDMTKEHPWTQFGIDLLLGINADMRTGLRQQEFLPNNLMHDFDHAQIYEDGEFRLLVKERRIAVPAGVQVKQESFPLSPMACGIILTIIGLTIFFIEKKKRIIFVAWEILLMIVTGIIGVVLFIMLFSQHPTVSLNLQFIFFNPLPWFFLWPVFKKKATVYWTITPLLAVLFFVGGIFQSYAIGIHALALCLLLQSMLHYKRAKK